VAGDLAAGLEFTEFGDGFESVRVVDTHLDAIDARRSAQGANDADQHRHPDHVEEGSVGIALDFCERVFRVATPCEYE
jgi:hypothetical protein